MATATGSTTAPVTCRKCGAPVSGRFCSDCGTALDAAPEESWSAIVKQVAKGDGSALAATAFAILREPVAAPVRLALDPAYGGHMKFYLTVVSAAFAALFVAPQELSRRFLDTATAGDHSLVKRMMVLQALIVLVLTPTLYYFFRWRSGAVRSPLSFFKLSLLTIAASNIATVAAIAVLFAIWLAGVYFLPFDFPADDESRRTIMQTILTAGSLMGLAYVVAINARFWRLHWIWPAVVLLAAQLCLELVSWPILNALGDGALGSLFK